MPIESHHLIWRPSAMVSDAAPAQNGGVMRFATITSGLKNNIFPDVPQSERLAGSTKYRKLFFHVANPRSSYSQGLQNVRIFLDTMTPGDDYVLIYPGTQSDTQDQLIANTSARPYGIGRLVSAAAAGTQNITVIGENATAYEALRPFRVGDTIRVSTKASAASATGDEAFSTIASVSYANGEITIGLSSQLPVAFPADALVSSVMTAQMVKAAAEVTGSNITGASSLNFELDNAGTIHDDWTITFNSATVFTVSGARTGPLQIIGNTTSDFAPTNQATGSPYFTIRASEWRWLSGLSTGKTISFTTTPSAVPIWAVRVVPPNTASVANNGFSIAAYGEGA